MNPEDIVFLERAVTLLENLNLNDSAHPEYRFLLALCYREKSELLPESDNKQSVALLEKLCAQFPQVPEYQFELGVTLADVPVHNFRDAMIEDSIDGLQASLQQLNSLTRKHPNIPRYTESCAHTHHKLGTLLRKSAEESPTLREAKIDDSQRHLRMAVRLQTTQCQQFPESISEKIWLARMRDNLARSLLLGKQPNAALSLIELSIAESSSIAPGEGDRVPSIHILIGQHETQADIFDDLGRQEDAEAARREANDLREYLPPHRQRGGRDRSRGGRR
jgi:hypothetical protein